MNVPIETRLTYSIPEAATALGVSRSLIYKLIDAGKLKPSKILGRTVFTQKEIDRFVASLEEDAA